jgi:hypothetical protein
MILNVNNMHEAGIIVQKVSGSRKNPELGEQQVPTIF